MKFVAIIGIFALVGSVPSTPGQHTSHKVRFRPSLLFLIHSLNSPFRNVRTFRELSELGSVEMEIASARLPGISPILLDVGGSGLLMEITMRYSHFISIRPTKGLPGPFIRTATSTVGMCLMTGFREKGHYAGPPLREYSLGPSQPRPSMQGFYNLELENMRS